MSKLDKEMTQEHFEEELATLDFDGDEEISMAETVNFIHKRLNRQELLLIGVYWIGHCLNPKDEINDLMTKSSS